MKYTKYRFVIKGEFETNVPHATVSGISHGLELQMHGYTQYGNDPPKITRIDVQKIEEEEK